MTVNPLASAAQEGPIGRFQAGLLTPLTFARHRLSPFGCFYFQVRTFITTEGGDSEFVNFTLPTLKAFLEARSQNVYGNKQ